MCCEVDRPSTLEGFLDFPSGFLVVVEIGCKVLGGVIRSWVTIAWQGSIVEV
jgi:hypothetical protein